MASWYASTGATACRMIGSTSGMDSAATAPCRTAGKPAGRSFQRRSGSGASDSRNRDRRQFAAARVLVRRVLSRYAPVEPEVWEFAYSSLGKPSIAPRFGLSDLRFNSAHTRDLVACAVAHQDDVGVDVECLDHDPGPLVARHSLSDEERAQYEQLRSIEQNRYFFRLWTLKEAYAKGRRTRFVASFPAHLLHSHLGLRRSGLGQGCGAQ